MSKSSISRKMIRSFSVCTFIILIVYFIYVTITVCKSQMRQAYLTTQITTEKIADEINDGFDARYNFLKSIKLTIENKQIYDREQGLKYVKYLVQNTNDFQGIYFLFEPNSFDGQDARYAGKEVYATDKKGRFQPWWYKTAKGIETSVSEDPFDDLDYYKIPKESRNNELIEPYVDEDIKILMASFVSPIICNNQFVGIVGGDVTLDYLDTMIKKYKIFNTGYAFLISKNGTLVSYPEKALIGKATFDSLITTNNQKLKTIHEELFLNRAGHIDAVDPLTHKKSVFFYEPIGETKWGVIVVVPQNEMLAIVYEIIIGMSLLGIVSLFVFLLIAKVISKGISKPVIEMTNKMMNIAEGERDLTAQIEIHSDDELGEMAHYFNLFVHNLRTVVSEFVDKNKRITLESRTLFSAASTINEHSSDIHKQVEQLSNSSEQILSEITTIKSTTEQASHNMDSLVIQATHMHDNVSATKNSTDSTTNTVQKATEQLEKVVSSITSLSSYIKELTSDMESSSTAVHEMSTTIANVSKNAQSAHNASMEAQKLAVSANQEMLELQNTTQEISKIIKMIDTITDQTNLLALNATIEAASAGDAGKGFAVVANEVKILAKSTAQATEKIASQIEQVINSVSTVANSFNQIIIYIQQLYEINHSIATAVEEESIASNSISQSVERSAKNAYNIEQELNGINQISSNVLTNALEASAEVMSIAKNTNLINQVSKDVTRNSEEAGIGINCISQSTSQINENVLTVVEKISNIYNASSATSKEANQLHITADVLMSVVNTINELISKFKI